MNRGHTLTFREPKENPSLKHFDKYMYDNLIIFAPTAEDLGSSINLRGLLDFVDSGRNVLVGAGTNVSGIIEDFANECGVDFDDRLSVVYDHQHVAPLDSGFHTVITASNLQAPTIIVPPLAGPIVYEGIAHAVNPVSPLLLPLLRASSTAYSYLAPAHQHTPEKRLATEPQSAGPSTVLVSVVQTRETSHNARVAFAGSVGMFSNEFFAAHVPQDGGGLNTSSNAKFCTSLVRWTFQEKGLLRTRNLTHHAVGKSEMNPHTYRLSDTVCFSIVIEEYDGDKREWVPFTNDDVRLEFVMMDPYHRAVMTHDGKGLYSHTFMIPDNFGVFKFSVQYHRPGWSNLDVTEQVAVRPFRHNEYERFLTAAFPYYASAASMMVGFFLFGIIFLYHKDEKAPASTPTASSSTRH
jgi:oligosaccharyltransferase complex subunit beta